MTDKDKDKDKDKDESRLRDEDRDSDKEPEEGSPEYETWHFKHHGRGHGRHEGHGRGFSFSLGDSPGIHIEGPEGLRVFADKLREGLGRRANVVMVRVNEEVLEKLEDLVEAGIFKSQSESAAFLIQEGIKAQDALFQKIGEHTKRIRELREELKSMVNPDEPAKDE